MDYFEKIVEKASELNLAGVELVSQVGTSVARREYNGIGPEFFPAELRRKITEFLGLFEPAALIHDLRNFRSNGSRWTFRYANDEFLANCRACASDAYPWYSWKRYRAWIVAKLLYDFVSGPGGWKAWMDCYDKNQKGTKK